ncbi:MAG: LPS export ABC transporter permease LptF [Deltaproteobacteria bacterium RIFCSPHIGHO2_02_FULL_40_11]|nr:MAG: LPS export ABC transporter permease LptF [Deltaproteobacteria bacterium RIFCSPHIGHO2_02_FULL_40_11]
MQQKIIFRYILKELFTPFFLGLSVFVFILVMSQMLRLNELVIVHGVGLWTVLKLLFYLLTSFLGISIPIALLFSVLMVFGRLSTDSEITAMRASGFSLFQLLSPVIVFSVIVCAFCLYLTLYLENWGSRSYRQVIFEVGKNKASVGLKEGIFTDDFFGLVMYAQRVNEKDSSLQNVFIYDQREQNRPMSVVSSAGQLISSSELNAIFLVLQDGSIHSFEKDYESIQKINFDRYTINLTLDKLFEEDTKERAKWLSIPELRRRTKEEYEKGNLKKARDFESEFHRKFAVAFVSLIFAIIGVGLGIKSSRAIKSLSFVYTLLLVGAYWGLYINARNIAISGIIPPWLAMWLPNLLFLVLALYLVRRANRQ